MSKTIVLEENELSLLRCALVFYRERRVEDLVSDANEAYSKLSQDQKTNISQDRFVRLFMESSWSGARFANEVGLRHYFETSQKIREKLDS